jgi:hypothetical protein
MMRCFMTSWSLTWGAELNQGPDGSDTMTFPGENTIMMVYGGWAPLRMRCVSKLSSRAPTHYGWEHGGSGV